MRSQVHSTWLLKTQPVSYPISHTKLTPGCAIITANFGWKWGLFKKGECSFMRLRYIAYLWLVTLCTCHSHWCVLCYNYNSHAQLIKYYEAYTCPADQRVWRLTYNMYQWIKDAFMPYLLSYTKGTFSEITMSHTSILISLPLTSGENHEHLEWHYWFACMKTTPRTAWSYTNNRSTCAIS